MPLHLKAGDGDLPLIMEPALLTRCAGQSHAIYFPALCACVKAIVDSFMRLHRLGIAQKGHRDTFPSTSILLL